MQASERIILEKLNELERLIREFKEKFEAGTGDADHFISMQEIERLWGELRNNTDVLYSDMVQNFLGSIDESSLVRKKKENTGKKGSP